jgi:hypothetical protein
MVDDGRQLTRSGGGSLRRDVGEESARNAVGELAFAPWTLITAGRFEEGLAIFDDAGTWWSLSSRVTRSIADTKPVLRSVFGVIKPVFTYDRPNGPTRGADCQAQ